MMSSSSESFSHTTSAHRAPRRAVRSTARCPSARYERYEPHLDGLFTYCLSVLCDHDAATEALGAVLSVSERQHGRCPSEAGERKVWLYALARWACLRMLAERRRERPGAHSGQRTPAPAPAAEVAPETAARRRRDLALLAWPEAAGTSPEQREVLELAVRHRLGAREVAAVLSMRPTAARELLSSAACEVERTRAALAVVATGDCPSVARLTGDSEVRLSAALRRELVRHVDDCPRCRRAAERAEAAGPWPGSHTQPAALGAPDAVGTAGPGAPHPPDALGSPCASAPADPLSSPASPGETIPSGAAASSALAVSPGPLPLVEAPRTAAYIAAARAPRGRGVGPRFGRDGFPLDPKEQAARRERLRARAVTSTVVATVVAAPLLALGTAYRSAPTADPADPAIGAEEPERRAYGHDRSHPHTGGAADPGDTPDSLVVEVVGDGTTVASASLWQPVSGRITVEARPDGRTTLITLRASGGAPVAWSARATEPWLRLSRHHGTLAPGESYTIRVSVDRRREPPGPWSAGIALRPAGSVVKIYGHGSRPPSTDRPPGPGHHPGRPTPGGPSRPRPTDPDGNPTGNPTQGPTKDPTTGPTRPSPIPGDPTPTAPGDPTPQDPGPSDPGAPGSPAPSAADPSPGTPT
ncbi:BACON domain-containing protein [Streptomyces sp. NPDC001840]